MAEAARTFSVEDYETWLTFHVGLAYYRLKWHHARIANVLVEARRRTGIPADGFVDRHFLGDEEDVRARVKSLYDGAGARAIPYKVRLSATLQTALKTILEEVAKHPEPDPEPTQTRKNRHGKSRSKPTAAEEEGEETAVRLALPELSVEERAALREDLKVRGRQLLVDIIEATRRHYYFEEAWQATLVAVFVMQAWLAPLLPAVFYIAFGGKLGSGKTNILMFIHKATRGLVFENVSIAALARSIGEARDGVTVLIDEADVHRDKEYDQIRDSLLRQGYKRGASYIRWNMEEGRPEEVPIFGPKAFTFRGAIDDALTSRTFTLGTAAPIGEQHYQLVLENLFPHLRDLPDRLEAWGKDAFRAYTLDDLEAIARAPESTASVARVVDALGANRESELLTIVNLVTSVAGLEVQDQVRQAALLRRTEAEAQVEGALDELQQVVVGLADEYVASEEGKAAVAAGEPYRLLQRDVHARLNNLRKSRREPKAVGDHWFARLRNDLGVRPAWFDSPGNRLRWNLPPEFVEKLRARQGEQPAQPAKPSVDPEAAVMKAFQLAPEYYTAGPWAADVVAERIAKVNGIEAAAVRSVLDSKQRDGSIVAAESGYGLRWTGRWDL